MHAPAAGEAHTAAGARIRGPLQPLFAELGLYAVIMEAGVKGISTRNVDALVAAIVSLVGAVMVEQAQH